MRPMRWLAPSFTLIVCFSPDARAYGPLGTDGRWLEQPPLVRPAPIGVVDPDRRRFITFGSGNGTWMLNLDGVDPRWRQLEVSGEGPNAALAERLVVYDPRGRRVLLWGVTGTSDLWQLTYDDASATWSRIPTGGSFIPPFSTHRLLMDAEGNRVLLLGGYQLEGVPFFLDLHELVLEEPFAWKRIRVNNFPGPNRTRHYAAFDDVNRRILLYGGMDADADTVMNDVWELELPGDSLWRQLPQVPAWNPGGYGKVDVFDSQRQQWWFFGGLIGSEGGFGIRDMKIASVRDSIRWSDAPDPAPRPEGRGSSAFCWDPVARRIVVSGGALTEAKGAADTWFYSVDPGTWSLVEDGGIPPAPRGTSASCFDPARNSVLAHGGRVQCYPLCSNWFYYGDLWEYAFGTGRGWRQLDESSVRPERIAGHAMVMDADSSIVWLYGGEGFDGLTGALWKGYRVGIGIEWHQQAPGGIGPGPRVQMAMAIDPIRRRLIVHGGSAVSGLDGSVFTLPLDGSTEWSQIIPTGPAPEPRSRHELLYDAARDRMVMLGGATSSGPSREVWALSLGPTPAWSRLDDGTGAALTRPIIGAGIDPNSDRIVGMTDTPYEFRLDAPSTWRLMAPEGFATLGEDPVVAMDPNSHRLVTIGGYGFYGSNYISVWTLQLQGPLVTAPAPSAPKIDAHSSFTPNPFSTQTRLRFEAGAGEEVTIEVFDIHGRRLISSRVRTSAAGPQEWLWNGRDAIGASAIPGVYFGIVRTGGKTSTTRLVRLN